VRTGAEHAGDVGAADAAELDPYERLTGCGLRALHLLDTDVAR
jgi:hypothetical protein